MHLFENHLRALLSSERPTNVTADELRFIVKALNWILLAERVTSRLCKTQRMLAIWLVALNLAGYLYSNLLLLPILLISIRCLTDVEIRLASSLAVEIANSQIEMGCETAPKDPKSLVLFVWLACLGKSVVPYSNLK